jgi:hypothetical protein
LQLAPIGDDMAQWVSRVRTEALLGWHSAGTDKLWAAAMTDRPLKPLVDITVQNTALHHMKYVAVEPAGVDPISSCHDLLVRPNLIWLTLFADHPSSIDDGMETFDGRAGAV